MPGAEKVTEGHLERLHFGVADAFRTGLDLRLAVRPSEETLDWKGALPKTRIRFAAKPTSRCLNVEYLEDGMILFSIGDHGAAIPIWVSWCEEWIKTSITTHRRAGPPSLDLIGVSICFFVGNASKSKTQLLRAEWDNPAQRGNDAAQPHWHIDPSLMDLPFGGTQPAAHSEGGLEELETPEGTLLSLQSSMWELQRLHLGMAGWMHRGDSPGCWQHKLELELINEWLNRVLVYCKNELPRITIAR